MNHEIDIIIITRNGLNDTKRCLESLSKNTQLRFRLIHIDNASSDGTLDWVKKFCQEKGIPLIQKRNTENKWIAASLNQGYRLSSSEILVFLNNDLLFAPKAIDFLVKELKENQEVWLTFPTFTRKDLPKNFPKNQRRDKVGIPLFCFAIKRIAFEKIGLFDERFRLWRLDRDFVYRLIVSSHPPKEVKESYVHHFESKTMDKLPNKMEIIQEDIRRFAEKYKEKEPKIEIFS